MVTDATWVDLDNNGRDELIVLGEWMGLVVFEWVGNRFAQSEAFGLEDYQGWWFSIAKGDFDNDGDIDLIAGNLGLNYKYQAADNETFDLYVGDFDQNESNDLVLGYYNNGQQFPVRGKQCSSEQIPAIKYKFKDYNSFSTATIEDIYGKKGLENSIHFQVKSFSSKIMLNDGAGRFVTADLPIEAQYAPINDMIVTDVDNDGNLDIILAGNLYSAEVETPRSDSGIGLVLKGNGNGTFQSMSLSQGVKK
jgi:hypothetical protein